MNKKNYVFIAVVFPLFYSCVSLNEVTDYATTSARAVNSLDTVNYTFSEYCIQDCELQQMRAGKIDTLFKCACEETSLKADVAIRKIDTVITAYLVALQQLSDNKNYNYDVSKLTLGLQQNPLLHLTDEQVTSYTKAGNFIATAVTAGFRKRKLNQYIETADPLFQQLTKTFIFLIDKRLRTQLQIGHEVKRANISQMLDNAKNDKGFKQVMMKWYLDEKKYFAKHDSLINDYTALLRAVQKGHHTLYLHRNNLKSSEAKQLIKNYQRDIQDILISLNK